MGCPTDPKLDLGRARKGNKKEIKEERGEGRRCTQPSCLLIPTYEI